MNTVKAYFSRNYWRWSVFANMGRRFFEAVGFLWFVTEIAIFVIPAWQASIQAIWQNPCIIGVLMVYALWKTRPLTSVCERLDGTDIQIEVCIGDIFTLLAAYVIPTNTTFDTKIDGMLISEKSLQGMLTHRFYDRSEHLDFDIQNCLKDEVVIDSRESKVGGKTNRYRIGTVVRVKPKSQTVYLVASSELNENGVAASSLENVKQSVAMLWNYISSKGELDSVAIPLLGTGHGRITTPRVVVVREIIKSFVAACSERKFINKLIVVISAKDYMDHEIDIYELRNFLRYMCRYTELSPSGRGTGIGSM